MHVQAMVLAVVLLLPAGASLAASGNAPGPLVSRAADFMRAYADDLKQGNRAALAARYHPEGSYVLGNGHKAFESHAKTVELYNTKWTRPADFEWQDMSYEQVGPSTVAVFGRFKWFTAAGAKPTVFSYSALLMLVDGQFRIRSEDESTSDK